jgi:hypothetical protein
MMRRIWNIKVRLRILREERVWAVPRGTVGATLLHLLRVAALVFCQDSPCFFPLLEMIYAKQRRSVYVLRPGRNLSVVNHELTFLQQRYSLEQLLSTGGTWSGRMMSACRQSCRSFPWLSQAKKGVVSEYVRAITHRPWDTQDLSLVLLAPY